MAMKPADCRRRACVARLPSVSPVARRSWTKGWVGCAASAVRIRSRPGLATRASNDIPSLSDAGGNALEPTRCASRPAGHVDVGAGVRDVEDVRRDDPPAPLVEPDRRAARVAPDQRRRLQSADEVLDRPEQLSSDAGAAKFLRDAHPAQPPRVVTSRTWVGKRLGKDRHAPDDPPALAVLRDEVSRL